MSEETCGSCRFWRRVAPLQAFGHCFRNPPAVLLVGFTPAQIAGAPANPRVDSFFPMTPDVTPACGEFTKAALVMPDIATLDVKAMEGTA